MTPTRVVFIGGAGRSGSTLLERILATAPGVVAGGEIVHLWDRGVREDQLCGCEQSFHTCPHWTAVGERAFGGWSTPDVAAASDLRHRVDRQRNLPGLMAPALATPTFRRDLRTYAGHLGRLYEAIAHVGGGHTVIDSSKHGSTAQLLRHVPNIDLQIILLVRHPGGVSYSWTKSVKRPEVTSGDVHMPTYSPGRAAVDWMLRNLEVHAAKLVGVPVTVVRYEDVVEAPGPVLTALATEIGLPDAPVLRDHAVTLTMDHTVAGNPMRFRRGELTLVSDDAWRDNLPVRDQRLVGAVTAPLAIPYGYTRRRSS